MSRFHEEGYNNLEDENEYEDEGQAEVREGSKMDMGYLEDDIEEYGEFDDDFTSVWRDRE
jgi:hypothetical protein